MTATDRLSLIMTDLLEVLKAPPIPSPIFNSQRDLATAISTLQSILGRDHTTPATPPPPAPTPTPTPITTDTEKRGTRSKPVNLYPMGTIIRRWDTDSLSFHEGAITSFDAINNLYHVKFLQGDREEFTYDEIRKYRKKIQKYAKYKPIRDFNNSVLFIPTQACPNPVKADFLRHHQALLLQQQHGEYVNSNTWPGQGQCGMTNYRRWQQTEILSNTETVSYEIG